MFNISIPLGNEVSLQQAFFISIFSMLVVFIVLLIIATLIDAVFIFLYKTNKKMEDNK